MVLGWIGDLIQKLIDALTKLFFTAIWKLIIGIVSVIYSVAYYLYQIFLALANVNVFDGKIFENIVSKLYIVIGVVTLFALAYNFLTYIIDPNKNKSGAEIEKLIKNTVTSFIMIILCPLIFKYAIGFQEAVLTQNFIGKVFSEQTLSASTNDDMSNRVSSITVDIFREFFTAGSGSSDSQKNKTEYKSLKCENKTYDCSDEDDCKLSTVDEYVNCSGDFMMYKAFAWNIYLGKVDFNWFVAAGVGIYLCYVLICFCFDMASRQVKLIFYQIISPICISCRLIPSKEKVFKTWATATFKTWAGVFTRLALLCISVLLIEKINDSWGVSLSSEICKNIKCSAGVQTFAKIFLILACVTFLKEGAKLISDLFGFDDVGFGLKDKLKEAGGIAGAAAGLGFGAAGLVKGTINGKGNPLAGIRAARENYKNRNLSGNRAELERSRARKQAIANGAKRSDLAQDYMRKKLGMMSLQEKKDMEIEDSKKVEDKNGNALKYQKTTKTDANGKEHTYLSIVDGDGNEIKTVGEYGVPDKDGKTLDSEYDSKIGKEIEYDTKLAQDLKLELEGLDRQLKGFEEQIRQATEINEGTQAINQTRAAIMNRVEEKLKEGKGWWGKEEAVFIDPATGASTKELKFSYPVGEPQKQKFEISGDFATASKQVSDLMATGNLDDASKAELQAFWDKQKVELIQNPGSTVSKSFTFTTAPEMKEITLSGNFASMDSTVSKLMENPEIDGATKKKIQTSWAEARENMIYAAAEKASTPDADGKVKDNVVATDLTKIKNAIGSGNFRQADGTIAITQEDVDTKSTTELLSTIKSEAGRIKGETEVKVDKINISKGQVAKSKQEVEHLERLVADTKARAKTSDEYQGAQASAAFTSNNPDIFSTGHNGGKK